MPREAEPTPTFIASPTPSASPLDGSEWILTSLNGKEPVEGSTMSIALSTERKFAAEAGCRRFTGLYRAEGDHMTIFGFGTSEQECPDLEPFLHQEAEYTNSLSYATHYRLDKDRLEIYTAYGTTLVFVPRPKQ